MNLLIGFGYYSYLSAGKTNFKPSIMKILITTCLAFISTLALAGDGDAPSRQKVYSIVKQRKTLEWYQTQEKLWEEEVENNASNADAWLNLFTASRMVRLMGGSSTVEDQTKIVERAKAAVPNSFEYHYIVYWNSNHEPEAFEHLKKAYQINPERPETYDDFVAYYELSRNQHQFKLFCEKWFDSNDMSPNLYAWAFNVLNSIDDENAILITEGDNDTFPLWVLQQVKDVKPNVAVLNASLLMEDDYRNKRFKELGIKPLDQNPKQMPYKEYREILTKHLIEHGNRAIYFPITANQKYYKAYEADMYMVGMVYKWCANDFDNIAVLKKNYEQNFMLDYLKLSMFNDISQSIMDHANGSYLAPFITLHNHYEEAGEAAKKTEIESLIYTIAKSSNQTEQIDKVLRPGKSSGKSEVLEKSRDALKGMLKLNAKLYVGQTEVSNDQYNLFLTDLMKLGRHEDLKKAAPNQVNWESLVPKALNGLDNSKIYQHGYPNDGRLPVCNLTYEAAEMYCEWLTNFYNNVEDKKKLYKKVKFYLPTEEQWQNLAIGRKYDGKYNYPWGGVTMRKGDVIKDTIVNNSGCYMANVNTNARAEKEGDVIMCENHDGGVFTVPVNSYNPNDYGLYCVIGNVAEMIQEKGVAKGGGWDTPIKDAVISAKQKYEGSSPNVGFRVVMEVIEE